MSSRRPTAAAPLSAPYPTEATSLCFQQGIEAGISNVATGCALSEKEIEEIKKETYGILTMKSHTEKEGDRHLRIFAPGSNFRPQSTPPVEPNEAWFEPDATEEKVVCMLKKAVDDLYLGKDWIKPANFGGLDWVAMAGRPNARPDFWASVTATFAKKVAETGFKIHVLDFSGMRLTEEGIGKLDERSLADHLKVLVLEDSGIGDIGAKSLAKISLPKLKWINLAANEISDSGAESLANISWPMLEVLIVENNEIGDSGAKSLANAFPMMFPNLKKLDISDNNKIGADVRKSLRKKTTLNGLKSFKVSVTLNCMQFSKLS